MHAQGHLDGLLQLGRAGLVGLELLRLRLGGALLQPEQVRLRAGRPTLIELATLDQALLCWLPQTWLGWALPCFDSRCQIRVNKLEALATSHGC